MEGGTNRVSMYQYGVDGSEVTAGLADRVSYERLKVLLIHFDYLYEYPLMRALGWLSRMQMG